MMNVEYEKRMAEFRLKNFKVRISEDEYEEGEFRIETTHNGYQYQCTHGLNRREQKMLYKLLTDKMAEMEK
jgi:hypothetical protein